MKKKKGFTLAEVLITLGIIGVVAAITLPSLLADTASAQVGPKLAKAVSMFEQANEALLNANSTDTISDAGILAVDLADYLKEFRKHMKGSSGTKLFTAKDGVTYKLEVTAATPANITTDPPHMQRIGNVTIDINGTGTKPDQAGTDVFYFSWWNDGSLRPKGGTDWDATDKTHWSTVCKADSVPTKPEYCAGHIFENNFKVLYR